MLPFVKDALPGLRECVFGRTTGALCSKFSRLSSLSSNSKLLSIGRVSENARRSRRHCKSTWSCPSRHRESLVP